MVRHFSRLAAVLLAATLASSCGGGGSASNLDVGVFITGQPQTTLFPGSATTIAVLAGQSVVLQATEPVDWAFSVNDSPLFASGTTVQIGGLVITQSALSPSRVVIDTALVAPTVLPVFVQVLATSTFDAAVIVDLTLQID